MTVESSPPYAVADQYRSLFSLLSSTSPVFMAMVCALYCHAIRQKLMTVDGSGP